MKKSKILLIENFTASLRRSANKYKRVFVFSGKCRGARILPHDFLTQIEYLESHHRAGMVVDWVYERYISNKEGEKLNAIMQDGRAEATIKKQVLRYLGEIALSFIMAEKFIKEYDIKEKIDFIPKEFPFSLYALLNESKGLFPENVRIPAWYLNKLKFKECLKGVFYRFALVVYPFVVPLLMSVYPAKTEGKLRFKYGMFLWDTALQLPVPPCLDLLVDNNHLRHDELLFYMDNSINESDLNRKIKSRNYNYCYFKEMVRHFNIFQYFRDIFSKVRGMSRYLFSIASGKAIVNESFLRSLVFFVKWEIFYAKYHVDTFLYVQEPGNMQRVICQKMHGSKNIFIFLSTSFDPVFREDVKTPGDSNYSFMIFDTIASSRMSNDHFRLNKNNPGSYFDCGILYSDLVYRIKHDIGLKNELRARFGIPAEKVVIAFFDTAIGRMAMFTEDEGFRMISDILRLLESNDKYYLLYKSRGDSNLSKNSKVETVLNKLINHKGVFYVNKFIAKYYYRPQYFMGISDLVIGAFSSSVPLEAVAGGVRTICHVPSKRFDSERFVLNRFPRFCASNYEELKEFSDYWINRCSEDDFLEFQDNYVKKHVDSYCDGKALDRLYALLKQ